MGAQPSCAGPGGVTSAARGTFVHQSVQHCTTRRADARLSRLARGERRRRQAARGAADVVCTSPRSASDGPTRDRRDGPAHLACAHGRHHEERDRADHGIEPRHDRRVAEPPRPTVITDHHPPPAWLALPLHQRDERRLCVGCRQSFDRFQGSEDLAERDVAALAREASDSTNGSALERVVVRIEHHRQHIDRVTDRDHTRESRATTRTGRGYGSEAPGPARCARRERGRLQTNIRSLPDWSSASEASRACWRA
jgi:hypothetical protein